MHYNRNRPQEDSRNPNDKWIAVDLDGTLAFYDGWKGISHIGEPITPMVNRVKQWLSEGKNVKIFTARAYNHGLIDGNGDVIDSISPIKEWCLEHIGCYLPVTNIKDLNMSELWDDRAIQVKLNTGIPVE